MTQVRYWISFILVCFFLASGCDDYFDFDYDFETEGDVTMTIASFNIRVFGSAKAGKAEVMDALAAIVRRYDIVAVQEIKDASGETPLIFLDLINSKEGGEYGMLLSDRTGRQFDDTASREQYAYYFNTDTVRVIGEDLLFDDSARDLFQREPYLARFAAVNGSFTCVLVNMHTKPDPVVTVKEIDAMHDVIVWAKTMYDQEDDFIITGDLNAACGVASPQELDLLAIRGAEYVWIVPDDADTSVGESQCAYDRIIITADTEEKYTGSWGVETSFTDDDVSDHWPVWAEFHTRKSNYL
jgi:endonuclease/exonuclease/phosphatase family metal-dependent hydrolase